MTVTSGGVDSWCYNYITNGSLVEGQHVLTPHLATDPSQIAWDDYRVPNTPCSNPL